MDPKVWVEMCGERLFVGGAASSTDRLK